MTQRSLTDLLLLYPDNTTGQISPEDLRDGIESLAGGFGGLYGNGSVGSVGTSDVLIDWWDTLLPDDADNDVQGDLGNNRINFTTDGIYQVHFSAYCNSGAVSRFFTVRLFRNGSAIGGQAVTQANADADSNGIIGQVSISTILSVTAGDNIDARVFENSTTGNTFSAEQQASFWAKRLN